MIIEIPTSNDFNETANDLLHSAWDQVSDLLIEFKELGDFTYGSHDENLDNSDYERYWKSAKQTVVTAFAMVQQGVEFYIKGRIASVSPFLLLSGSLSNWPKKCNKQDALFSTFRSVDAQDLIKLHDTVFPEKFTDHFKQWFEEMRISRNKIMHTVDKHLLIKPEDLLESILSAHHYFCGLGSWIKSRLDYLDGTPVHSIRHIREEDAHRPYLLLQVLKEMEVTVDKLLPAKIKKYFGFDKKKYSYNCPCCYETLTELDYFEPGYQDEHFKPYHKITENSFHCVICQHSGSLSGEQCFHEDCDSNFVDNEKGMCLICGAV